MKKTIRLSFGDKGHLIFTDLHEGTVFVSAPDRAHSDVIKIAFLSAGEINYPLAGSVNAFVRDISERKWTELRQRLDVREAYRINGEWCPIRDY
jgi:hypothetical protein